jgi:hypothetical protein
MEKKSLMPNSVASFSARIEKVKAEIARLSLGGSWDLKINPVSESAFSSLNPRIPQHHLDTLRELGEVSMSSNGCGHIELFIPAPLNEDGFYNFSKEEFSDYEHFVHFAHNVEGVCFGYDLRTSPLEIKAWDFQGCSPWPSGYATYLDLVEEYILTPENYKIYFAK